ncbi:unnamed protein product, partial [Laminaria digitata]
ESLLFSSARSDGRPMTTGAAPGRRAGARNVRKRDAMTMTAAAAAVAAMAEGEGVPWSLFAGSSHGSSSHGNSHGSSSHDNNHGNSHGSSSRGSSAGGTKVPKPPGGGGPAVPPLPSAAIEAVPLLPGSSESRVPVRGSGARTDSTGTEQRGWLPRPTPPPPPPSDLQLASTERQTLLATACLLACLRG